MKNKSKILLIISILFLPLIVFADDYSSELPTFIFIEAFITIHMSAFVLSPLSKILTPDNSKKTFKIMFMIRVIILLYFDFFVTPTIAIVDFILVFVGAFVIVPALSIKNKNSSNIPATDLLSQPKTTSIPPVALKCTKCNGFLQLNDRFCTHCGAAIEGGSYKMVGNKIIQAELRCVNCNGLLQVEDNFCQNCGTKIEGNNIKVVEKEINQIEIPKIEYVLPSNFDPIYSLPENQMLEEVIKKELTKAGIDINSNLIPSAILKRKTILNIILSFLIFIYISMIFFHFPIETYIIGGIILLILLLTTRNYNFNKYLKKEIQARPNEKISNIVMNVKNSFVTDNTKKSLIIGILISVVFSLALFKDPRIIYEKTDNGYAVRYYIYGLTNNKTVKIPKEHKGENVVSLRGNTFSNMKKLKKVELPDTILEIRGQAFKNCISLEEVNLPKNLKYLGGGAFYNATSIKNIELPDTLTELGGESFYGASSLEYVRLSNNLTEIRGNTFEGCISLKSITIPESVTRIGGHAFYGNTNLEEVIILGDNLEEIGSSAFRRCYNLREISIPQRTYINERAFKESPTEITRYNSYANK